MAPSVGAIFAAILAAVLLIFSGFASGSEIAFFSLSPNDLNELEDSDDETDKQILALGDDSERTLATILITNNLVNVAIIMLSTYFINHLIYFGPGALWLEFLVITVLLTFLLLLFGEIMPKVYCRQHALAMCRKFAGGIIFLRKLFYPIASVLIRSGIWASKVVQRESHVLSVDDLEQALELTDEEELKDEKNMLEGIVRFGDETAKEVMTSRQDVVDLDFRSKFPDVIKCIVENNYSRIPVYQDSIDNVRGILYIKDLLPHLSKPATFRWQSLIRPPYFVPETKKIDDLSLEAPVASSPSRISLRRSWARSTMSTTKRRRPMSASMPTHISSRERPCFPTSLRLWTSTMRPSMRLRAMPTPWQDCCLRSRATSLSSTSALISRTSPSRSPSSMSTASPRSKSLSTIKKKRLRNNFPASHFVCHLIYFSSQPISLYPAA